MPAPLRLAFLGCGFITRVHSRHLKTFGGSVVCSYASRDQARADACRSEFGGVAAYANYQAAIDDPAVDALVVAVPPAVHLELTVRGLAAGKDVLVEKPAFPRTEDFAAAIAARDRAGRVVIVGENDHYKPLAVTLRRWIAQRVIGDMVFAQFTTIVKRLKHETDWRNDETLAGGDAFFEEGIHWLHLAGSLGPRIVSARGFRPAPARTGGDRRAKSMLAAFEYDNGAVGALFYSREVPSLFKGLRLSKVFGRDGIITFESNGALAIARGHGGPHVSLPGFSDIRGYRAMYRDFFAAIRERRQPEMSLERALDDHRIMDQISRLSPQDS